MLAHSIITTAEQWAEKNPINPIRNTVIKTTENYNIIKKDLNNKNPFESK